MIPVNIFDLPDVSGAVGPELEDYPWPQECTLCNRALTRYSRLHLLTPLGRDNGPPSDSSDKALPPESSVSLHHYIV